MQSPVEVRAGWTGAPRTAERKRKGRGVDVISVLPTPPHTRHGQLPTPESSRRKPKPAETSYTIGQNGLPTPQTLPRPPRKSNAAQQDASNVLSPASPSGHTTFYLSNSTSRDASRADVKPRRRPGLIFASQMGLVHSSGGTSSFGARLGAGVGMGGTFQHGHSRADDVRGKLQPAATLDDNPFLVTVADSPEVGRKAPSPFSPADVIRRSAKDIDDDATLNRDIPSSPLASHSPDLFLPITPPLPKPPTFAAAIESPRRSIRNINKSLNDSAIRHKASLRQAEKEAERIRKEEMARMMDIQDNPFLVKPGEPSTPPRYAPPVDENRPFVTYVFRGTKRVFANPFLPTTIPFPPADLDVDDPEYESHPNPPPKLLWPTNPKRSRRMSLEEEQTDTEEPSTPPSRILRTPQTKRRFEDLARGIEVDPQEEWGVQGTSTAFSATQSELLGSSGSFRRASSAEEEGEEETVPVRRGLLFGNGNGTAATIQSTSSANQTNKGKRGRVDTPLERNGKRNRALRV